MSLVRLAEESDYDRIVEARMRFFDDQIDKGLLDIPLDLPDYLHRTTLAAIAQKRSAILVAESRFPPMSYSLLANKFVPNQRNPNVWAVEEFYVAPSARGVGAGRVLATASIEFMRAKNAERIQLRVLNQNGEGHAFWHRVGFRPALSIYELPEVD